MAMNGEIFQDAINKFRPKTIKYMIDIDCDEKTYHVHTQISMD